MKVVFLDRDGVINRDSNEYVKSWNEFEFLPRSLDALVLLAANGYSPVVITNQSGIARGLFTPETLADMHANMKREVEAAGGRLAGIYHCPHHPDDNCDCRKPEPGLLLAAARDLGVDLAATTMVGDTLKDVGAGKRAGCAATVLVRTGMGERSLARLERKGGPGPSNVAEDLYDAVQWILAARPGADARQGM
ncbi:MAG: D-glycero-beta-D-manno-heptose 1,7-bisphosphate 7-phosphatase [Desulfatibacillaceae bacterium]